MHRIVVFIFSSKPSNRNPMWQVLDRLFIHSYFKANTGFFLFFLFLFFGAVQGGSLVSYHLSLMTSFLKSPVVLLLVFCCWLLYHIKCTSFVLTTINREEGKFLVTLQVLPKPKQWLCYLTVYLALYSPVFIYALIAAIVGWQQGYIVSALSLIAFQVISCAFFTGIIYYRMNHWLKKRRLPSIGLRLQKNYFLFGFFYFTTRRKSLVLVLKVLSLSLLYIILIWNKGRYDNDAFLFFYLVLFLANAVLPFYAVQFWEKEFAVCRNVPVPLWQRGLGYLLPYLLLVLPECVYIIYAADAFSFPQRLAYCLNLPAGLSLLTAIQYSEAQSREEYLKASFALVFLSIFVLHVQAFWFWIGVQTVMAILLFANGYNQFERTEE